MNPEGSYEYFSANWTGKLSLSCLAFMFTAVSPRPIVDAWTFVGVHKVLTPVNLGAFTKLR